MCLAASGPVCAQDETFHWAYSAWFGTGRYSLDGINETLVIGFPPAWTWRESELSDTGERRIGYRFRAPVSIGTTEFSSFGDISDLSLDSISAVSVVPGVEVEIPMTPRWSLKPIGYLGYGAEMGGGDQAGIFRFGLRSQFGFQFSDTGMLLINAIERMGYSAEGDASDALNLLRTGLDFTRPLKNSRIQNVPVLLHWHVMYTSYIDTLGVDITRTSVRPAGVSSEWELGVGFSKQDERLGFWRVGFDRIALAYRFGEDGDFSGIGIVFQALFDR